MTQQNTLPPPSEDDDFWLFGYGYYSPQPPLRNTYAQPSSLTQKNSSLIWKPPPHYGTTPPVLPLHPSQKQPSLNDPPQSSRNEKTVDYRVTSKAMCGAFGKLGTPECPGRVVTLISQGHYDSLLASDPSTPARQAQPYRVWGAAYHIPAPHVKEVQAYLDLREINGYSIQYTSFTSVVPPAEESQLQQQQQYEGAKPIREIKKCMVYIGLPSNPQFLGPQDPDVLAERIWRCRGPSGENREYLFMLEEALRGLGEGAGDEHVEDLAGRVRGVGGASVGEGGEDARERAVGSEVERVRSGTNTGESEETEKS
ncbi:MAG: hypothetical protein Q9220_006796 [cf. Caloplaca sp. 1 TL-2023]